MGEQGRILIVDDSNFARLVARKAVEEALPEAVIVEAENGAHALELVDGQRFGGQGFGGQGFGVALLDLNMPDMDGLTLARELRRRCADIKLALCTANVQQPVRDRTEGLDMAFIEKPISTAKVRTFLQASR